MQKLFSNKKIFGKDDMSKRRIAWLVLLFLTPIPWLVLAKVAVSDEDTQFLDKVFLTFMFAGTSFAAPLVPIVVGQAFIDSYNNSQRTQIERVSRWKPDPAAYCAEANLRFGYCEEK